VAGGSGVTVTSALIELPGGDPNDPTDDITQFSINIGLPLNTDTVPFSAIRLGSQSGQIVDTISTAVDKATARSSALVTETALRNYTIGSDQIENGSVIEPKLATDSVSTNKILDEAVISIKLATGSVTEGKIATSAVTEGKIADLNVTEDKLAANAVTNTKVASNAVTYAKIQKVATANRLLGSTTASADVSEVQVETGMIAANAVTYAKIQKVATANRLLGSTTASADVSEVQVETDMIAGSAVTTGKIADNAVSATKLNGGQRDNAPIFGVRAWGTMTGGKTSSPTIEYGGNIDIAVTKLSGSGKYRFTMANKLQNNGSTLTPGSGESSWINNQFIVIANVMFNPDDSDFTGDFDHICTTRAGRADELPGTFDIFTTDPTTSSDYSDTHAIYFMVIG
jgi:hypothetical protein